MSNTDARYTHTAIALHWLVAALVIAQVAWGWWMQGLAKDPVGPRVDAFNLHKSAGALIFALMLVRLGWRIGHRPPPLPPMPRWQHAAARLSHGLLYATLLAQPVIGYLGSVWSGYPVRLFGIVLPVWGGRHPELKDAMSDLHLVVAILLMIAIGLHVTAALRHAAKHDGVLQRMLPRMR
ncbi:MAG: cytochrome b [Betaproteobacteria bacterium]